MSERHFDAIIVGAGLSGIGAACHLQRHRPDKTYAILEGRRAMGGTWDLFRYPGIRSDSDMYTLGYSFKPWTRDDAIADGPAILRYIRETAAENGIDARIRYGHRVTRASWSSARARWTLSAETGAAEPVRFSARHLLMCSGYYRYGAGHTPEFRGREDFGGVIVHPQHWPRDLDHAGKNVVVIGSGATAMTLVPAMAGDTAHIAMLQRSPTYVISRPRRDRGAKLLRAFLPDGWVHAIGRWKNIRLQQYFYRWTRRDPEGVKNFLLRQLRGKLGSDYDVETHFTPDYYPWDQRLCLIPDDDLHVALKSGRASVVTGEIERFTESGILLRCGKELAADIIVTATGLELTMLGEIEFAVDGRKVDFHDTWTYKGLMCSGVPNMVHIFGYINASWTLRADIAAEYFCRLANHMDRTGADSVTPMPRERDKGMRARPWIDDFSPGYMRRAMHLFPRQGDREPWINTQDYPRDKKLFRDTRFDDGALVFGKAG